ncbi:hypothetical protein ACFP3Q_14520 [Nocardioides sp. GCM10027113]|uniref:hypothetical protein n=1 Tax=unclassified Nocardioides TaxID=2615069 RepID=UPI00361F4947
MPKSRGRRPKKTHTRRTPGRPGAPATSRPESQTERARREFPTYLPILQATDAAEARGDALAALELMLEHAVGPDGKPFWRPERFRRLMLVMAMRPWLPAWVTSRWVLAQAAQHLDRSRRGVRALDVAIRVQGGLEQVRGAYPDDKRVKLMDHDWVHRQVLLYELGGLTDFVERVASADLLAGADHVAGWAGARMGGFRLHHKGPRTLAWTNVADGEPLETLNLGALVEEGEHVIGRVVPIERGHIFESAPLVVSAAAARSVSEEPDSWIDGITEEWRRSRSHGSRFHTHVSDFGIASDMPFLVRAVLAEEVAERLTGARGTDDGELIASNDQAQLELVRTAMRGELDEHSAALDVDLWPVVAAALLDFGVVSELVRGVSAADQAGFDLLAREVPEPAVSLCRHLARKLAEVA